MPVHPQFGNFDPGNPDGESWEEYVERFSFFFVANGTKDAHKLAVLLSVVGPEVFRTIRSVIAPTRLDSLSYPDVVERMRTHFSPAPSFIVQRCRFHRRLQLPGESITDYLTNLRKLAEHCQFANLNDRLRDQLVAGISDDKLKCRLLEEQDKLSFETALKIAVTFETAKSDTSKLRSSSSGVPIQKVFTRPKSNNGNNDKVICYRCGANHKADMCKYKKCKCRYCGREGHLERVCFKKKSEGETSSYSKKGEGRKTQAMEVIST